MNSHDGHEAEKGFPPATGYDTAAGTYSENFIHGHATVAEATGRGGDTHRGLKSRHIQFLYARPLLCHAHAKMANHDPGLSVAL